MIRFVGTAISFAVFGLPMATAQTSVVQYMCDIGGMQAQLTAQVEVVGTAGRVIGSDGSITGVIGTGESTVYYQGQLVSQTASYAFTGENEYADFTEISTYDRFRARMQVQGNILLITVNPFGPQPTQYACQQVG
ncbi:MAG: hypothetical protein AAFZ91_16670 [Pseudomonadota bacterium]